ncbi:hypothetical protein, partial [Sutterella wadsworthensis]|uniref:hypothetical protein n=1 Tax=Sutterella wadsworthensis TaxID=40545 RepID=UPI003FEE50BF
RLLPDSGNPKGKEEPSGDYSPAELPQNNRQQPWIHDAVVRQEKVFQPVSHSEGQMPIIGTMGSGKTRCFDLLIFRTFLRNGLQH